MTAAYSTFADGGVRHRPLAVTGITSPDGGTIVKTVKSPGVRVIPDWAASEMNKILYDNIYTCHDNLCTGNAGALTPYRQAAGKTGTVEAHLDAWFCGYTPDLATCVWMGFPQGEISMIPAVGSAYSFGGGYPTMIWNRFMTAAFAAEPHKFPLGVNFPIAYAPFGTYLPVTSHFLQYVAPKPKKKKPGAKGTGTGVTKSGNGNGNGNGNQPPPTTH